MFDLYPGGGDPSPIRASGKSPQVGAHYDFFSCHLWVHGRRQECGSWRREYLQCQRYTDVELAENPPPLPQRGGSLAKCCLRGGESTYPGQGHDGCCGVENPPPDSEGGIPGKISLTGRKLTGRWEHLPR